MRMSLRNFKGIRALDIELGGKDADIYGTNGVGKTSINDAYTWCLFGKDSRDRKDFNIKTLDFENNAINRLEHSVEVKLDIDGIHKTFRRVYREKWVKPRGAAEAELQGHEQEFFVDDVPMRTAKEYADQVAAVMDENQFKLVTNPLYFNGVLSWQERRGILEKMAGYVSDVDVADKVSTPENKHRVDALLDILTAGKRLEDEKARIAAGKKKIKEQLAQVPARLDEIDRQRPADDDWRGLEESIKTNTHQIQVMQRQLSDASASGMERRNQLDQLLRQQDGLKLQLRKISQRVSEELDGAIDSAGAKVREQQRSVDDLIAQQRDLEQKIKTFDQQIAEWNERATKLRTEWNEVNQRQFVYDDSGETPTCPTCGQPLPEADIAEQRQQLEAKFNQDKAERLAAITKEGKDTAARIQFAKEQREKAAGQEALAAFKLQSETSLLQSAKDALEQAKKAKETAQPAKDPEAEKIEAEIAELQKQVDALQADPQSGTDSNQALIAEINKFQENVAALQRRLDKRQQQQDSDKRKEQLLAEEKALNQELADAEGMEATIEAFTKAKMDLVQDRVNGLFMLARFKMFDQQLNGGLDPTCELVYNGVPWSDLNTAAKIQLGMDCIRTLARHYNCSGPIWVDNAESVVEAMPDMGSMQIVRLVASEADKKLNVKIK